MHDVLDFTGLNPVHQKYQHNRLTFGLLYAWTENLVLPLSHDEVVHGKGSLLARMPGDDWQRFANLRTLYAYMWAHPGKKLLFVGGEIGQRREWLHDRSLDWHLLDEGPYHRGLQRLVRDLNCSTGASVRSTSSTPSRPGSRGSIVPTRSRAWCRSCAAPERPVTSCLWYAASRRSRGMPTGSGSRISVITESGSIATRGVWR